MSRPKAPFHHNSKIMEEAKLMKPVRHVDEDLLSVVRTLPCVACASPPPSHAHHMKTRGAGGPDIAENVISLCMTHHRQIHDWGIGRMAEYFPSVRYWLEAAGWTAEEKMPGVFVWKNFFADDD